MKSNKKLKHVKHVTPIKATLSTVIDRVFDLKPKVNDEGKLEDAFPIKSSDVKEIRKSLKDPKPREKVKKAMGKILAQQADRRDQMTLLKKEYEHFRKRITEYTSKFGVSLLDKPHDKILYAAPYKSHLVAHESAGDLNEALIQKQFPELFSDDVKIDVAQLNHALSKTNANEQMQLMFKNFLDQIEALERASGLTIKQTSAEGMIDLERYEQYKHTGKITPEMVEKFESPCDITFTLREVEQLVDKPNRCSECGDIKPKRKVEGHPQDCERCGHSE